MLVAQLLLIPLFQGPECNHRKMAQASSKRLAIPIGPSFIT